MNERANSLVRGARIILFGSEGGFSRLVLQQLLTHELCVVGIVMIGAADEGHGSSQFPVSVKQPVKPGGLADLAEKNKVAVITTQKLDDDSFVHQLTKKRADILLVACFNRKIPKHIWQQMDIPCWNLHPSLLPKYRGPSPLYWQIKKSESETGLTLHQVTGDFDAGDIVARQSLPLPVIRDKNSLDNWVARHGVTLFCKTLKRYLLGRLKPEPQNESIACYFPNRE